jgi:hypothetical protein
LGDPFSQGFKNGFTGIGYDADLLKFYAEVSEASSDPGGIGIDGLPEQKLVAN